MFLPDIAKPPPLIPPSNVHPSSYLESLLNVLPSKISVFNTASVNASDGNSPSSLINIVVNGEPANLPPSIPDLNPASGFLAGIIGVPSDIVYSLLPNPSFALYLFSPTIFLESESIFPTGKSLHFNSGIPGSAILPPILGTIANV